MRDRRRLHRAVLPLAVVVAAAALGLAWSHRAQLRGRAEYWYLRLSAPPESLAELGDGGPALGLRLTDPMGLAQDARGNVYVSDRGRDLRGRVVWRIDPQGRATAIAGTGDGGPARGGMPARSSALGRPEGLAVDAAGRVYIVDHGNSVVLRVEGDGTLTRIAGTGEAGYGGDGGPATAARLNRPVGIRIDSRGNIYVADVYNHRIRRITPDGRIETVAGTGVAGYSGDGGAADRARLDTPWGIHVDAQDRLLIADSENHVIRRVEHDGTIRTIAGSGRRGYAGDGGPALAARFDTPQALYTDAWGRLYVGDEHNNAIRVIGTDGIVSTVAGTGRPGLAAAGVPARRAPLNDPENVLVRRDGTILVTESENGRVLRIGRDRTVEVYAGRAAVG